MANNKKTKSTKKIAHSNISLELPKNNLHEKDIVDSSVNTTTTKTTDVTIKGRSGFQKILDSLVGEKRELAKYWTVVKQIEDLEPQIQTLSDQELKNKTAYFREQLIDLKDKALEKKLSEI